MALFFVVYDIRSANHDYQPLYNQFAELHAIRVLQSLWCFNRINTTAPMLRDFLTRFIHVDDSITVRRRVKLSYRITQRGSLTNKPFPPAEIGKLF